MPHDPQYPRVGAKIDYYLANRPAGEVKLDILDSRGNVIRGFSSEETQNVRPDELTVDEWRLEQVGTPKLPTTAEMHRFLWDLRYPGPWDEDEDQSGRSGPMVPPGTYQARLTVGDWSESVSFEAKTDRRTKLQNRKRVKLPTFPGRGLQPGVDLDFSS